jgi:lipopolysaccharide export system permease protein
MVKKLTLLNSQKFNLFTTLFPNVSVMDRYIFIQLLLPFLFGVGAFSSIATSIGRVFELIRQVTESGLPLATAIKVLLLTMPEFLAYSFPMSILLATMMTFGRLSGDSEIIALRSSGVSVYRLIAPALALSIMITGLTFLLQQSLVPAAKVEAASTLSQALKQDKPAFKQENIIYPDYADEVGADGKKTRNLVRLFYARQFNGKEMSDVMVIDRSRSDVSQIINAKSGQMNLGEKTWDFSNGTIYVVDPQSANSTKSQFEHLNVYLGKTPLDLAAPDRDPEEMNISEKIKYLDVLRAKADWKALNTFQIKIQQNLALPFVCIIFALIGSAVGIRPQRGGKATSFGVSLLLIFGYYLVMMVMGGLGEARYLSPFLAGWMPNILGVGAAIYLLTKTAR